MKSGSARQLAVTLVPSLSILGAMIVVRVVFHVAIADMTRDISSLANIHPLSGFLSNLGALLWCAAASITGFAALTLRAAGPKESFRFLLSSSLLSAYLLFDDFFLFHDELAPWYLGVNELFVYAALGIAVAAYLFTFRRIILRTNFGALVLAMGFLSASVGMDAFFEAVFKHFGLGLYFWEDGAKWLGIACWCSYHVRTAHQLLTAAFSVHRQGMYNQQ